MEKRGRRAMTILIGIAVMGSLIVVPAIGQEPVTSDAGLLRLHLGADGDRFDFDPSDSSANLVQTLSQSNCRLSSGGDVLVSVVGDGTQTSKRPYAGLKDHRIGVGQNGEGNGEPCARINKDLGQRLTLSLTGDLAGSAIDYAEIDLGFKFNGNALLTLSIGGAFVDQVNVLCSGVSDCGPDSGADDNERVILHLADETPSCEHCQSFPINGVFDTIVIEPGSVSPSGSVSLEGGFNGSPAGPSGTTDTIFNVVEFFDGELNCGDNATETSTDGTIVGSINRLENTNDVDCVVKPFNLNVDDTTEVITFAPEPVAGQAAAYQAFLTFAPEPKANPADTGTLEYDQETGLGFQAMLWCEADPYVGTEGVDLSINPDVIPSGHTWCIVSETTTIHSLTETQTTWEVVGIGDPKFR